MSNERSAEWLRGAKWAFLECGEPLAASKMSTLLAAAEAREKEALGTDWQDPDVEYVYSLLGASELPGTSEEHWEGKVARMAVAYMRKRAAEDREATQPTAAEVIAACRVALEKLLRATNTIEVLGEYEALEINAGSRRTMRAHVEATIRECQGVIGKIARWKEANGV